MAVTDAHLDFPLIFSPFFDKPNVFAMTFKPIRLVFLQSAFLGLLLGGFTPAWAFSGAEGASFLEVPVGAGPVSLGSAYSSLSTDAYAPVWNAGGLGFLESTQLAGMHQSYVESTSFEYLSFVHPVRPGHALGVSAQYFRPGDLTRTDVSGNELGSFGGYYGAYSLAYGQLITKKAAVGVTGKIIQAKIDDVSASAYAADIGTYYRLTRSLTLAAVAANIGTKLKFLSEGDSLPMAFRGGASYQATRQIQLSGEGVYRKNGPPSFHLGVAWPSEDESGFSLRTGYSTERIRELSGLAGVAAGIGFPVWGHEVSYAWMPLGDIGHSHYFSLIMRFGEKPLGKDVLSPEESDFLKEGSSRYELLKDLVK